MAITINDYCKQAYKYFTDYGMTPQGASGLLGNIYAESGIIPNRVETLCLKRLKENGKTYTDASYTQAVNNGSISKAEFLNPLPGKSYGFGYCQWTSQGRKSGLYDRTVAVGKSIADSEAQLQYTIYELEHSYKSVLNVLKTSSSIQECSDKVLKDFETPDNWQSLSKERAGYAQDIYNALAKGGESTVTQNEAIKKVLDIAKAEVGYLEKNNANNLDDFTKGAGSGNYTKYWRDVYPPFQGLAWCGCYCSWVFMKAFGKDMAAKLLKHWPYTYCPTMADLFTLNANPKVGDIVIFKRNGVFTHTGIVYEVNGDLFKTYEGNTSSGASIIANGGGVCAKQYYNSQLPGTKFCTPDWSLVSNVANAQPTQSTPTPSPAPQKTSSSISEETKFVGQVVNTSTLNVRTWAGTDNKTVSFSPLKRNAIINVCDTVKASDGKDWYFISVNGKFGFVDAKYIKNVSGSSEYTVKVTATELNVRSGPSTDYPINAVIHTDEVYTIVEEKNGWGKLKSGVGWISLKYTTKC